MKTIIVVCRLLSFLLFIVKYAVVGYLIGQLVSGYGIHPPTIYYYPLLILLFVAIMRVQFILSDIATLYAVKLEKTEKDPNE